MSLENVNSYGSTMSLNQTPAHQLLYTSHVQQTTQEEDPKSAPNSKRGAVFIVAQSVLGIAQIVIASIGTAEKMSDTAFCYSLLAVSAVSFITPIAKFIFSSSEKCTSVATGRSIGGPIVQNITPIVCGALMAAEKLPIRTAGIATLSVTGGYFLLTTCVGCCIGGYAGFRIGFSRATGKDNDANSERAKIVLLASDQIKYV